MATGKAYHQDQAPSLRERVRDAVILGRHMRRAKPFTGKVVADVGCGYHATYTRSLLGEVREAILVDVALAPDLVNDPRVRPIVGLLPNVLDSISSETVDVVICSALVEHLEDPLPTLQHFRRILVPGGLALIAVPTWEGKRVLEFIAFRLGVDADGIEDHKRYYDPSELWPLLVKAGFLPSGIRCSRHWLRWNTLAACRVPMCA